MAPGRAGAPAWLRQKSRAWIADRYLWWSMASRGQPRQALQFLLIALCARPANPEAWGYVAGVLRRKLEIRRAGLIVDGT